MTKYNNMPNKKLDRESWCLAEVPLTDDHATLGTAHQCGVLYTSRGKFPIFRLRDLVYYRTANDRRALVRVGKGEWQCLHTERRFYQDDPLVPSWIVLRSGSLI